MNRVVTTLSRMILPLICLVPFTVGGESFFVEGALKPVAPDAVKAIKQYNARAGSRYSCTFHGQPVDLSGTGKSSDLIVTTKHACGWAASAGPVWILKNEGKKYKVILHFVTYDLDIMKKKSNGLYNIKTSRGTAGAAEVELWAFNGNMYKKTASYYFSASDDEACRAHPDICPFEIDE